MAEVRFFEKPGCVNNTRQKAMLKKAGHKVAAYNLLKYEWDMHSLRKFFGELPVNQWFNYTAPVIKQGSLIPETLNEVQALELMLDDPILIRRPLMQVDEEYMVGFDVETVDEWIGLFGVDANEDMESCPNQR